ncbi:MAG: Gfo/Idh/MocA family oxidoreductase [Candidatus Krumholzibacteria bacterium]|nr:Gfo/Idh/MocA family oxidoreductase [Candidatus Krumholzibacteria bacterium]MDH4338209.1 Gfo/Idh/MocA family oxidoreductase [Candidatus Krumholzibacteria bacterium]MDH5270884.1 Gfo/Idh/MocA family oxidoreductase [Candidatus Krumholzibacteria bacterium]MDH5626804.1 Gfo/Idh/MocA family oxidoreductase [Candidatus Krumholzibacteria bacterium]
MTRTAHTTGSDRVRVALVGAGYVATHHLRALKALAFVDVVGICDRDPARAQALADKFGVAQVYPDLRAMAGAKPHVIHILTPPEFHCPLALEAMDMGCHVFVEKPMAESVEECDRMIARAHEKGVQISVNHSDRFDPVVLKAIDMARSGACGDILAVHSIRSSDYPTYAGGPLPAPYRQGSYPFRDLGVHSMYLVEAFVGEIQKLEVKWYETGRDPMLTFDEWRAYAECENGTGSIYISWNTRPIQSELEVHGTRGVIRVDRFLQVCEMNRTLPGPKAIGNIINGYRAALRRSFRIPINLVRFMTGSLKPSPGIYNCVQAFHFALRNNKPLPVPPQEGRRMIAWVGQTCTAADDDKQARLHAEVSRELPPARVLVTGGAGFLGRPLVERLLARGDSVRLLLRRPPAEPLPDGVAVVYGSLGQPDVVDRAVEGVEVVYHVGAAMRGGAAEFEQGTVWGTRNVVDSCLRYRVKRLVYVSSLSVVDHAGHSSGVAVTENTAYEPHPDRRGVYTRTKMQAEKMVLDAIRERGLKAAIIRPGQIFGPGAERVTPNGVIGIAGRWIVAGNGSRALPLVYRDDVVDALLLAETSDAAAGQLINVVDPTHVTQNEYLRHCRTVEGVRINRVPVWLLMIGATGIEILGEILKREVPLTRYRIRSLKPLSPFDVTKAKNLLGWSPHVGVGEGLKRTFGG